MPKLKTSRIRLILLTLLMGPLSIHIGSEMSTFDPPILWALVAGVFFSPFIAAFGHRWMQFAVRGCWFAGVCWSTLALYLSRNETQPELFLWWLAFAGALIVAGRIPTTDTERFVPVRFGKTLAASLIFGLADFTTLAFIPLIIVSSNSRIQEWDVVFVCGASALGLAAALTGLYRMKVWGLFLCLTMNIVVVGWMFAGVIDFPDELIFMLTTTAVIQMLLPWPIFYAIFKSRKQRLAA